MPLSFLIPPNLYLPASNELCICAAALLCHAKGIDLFFIFPVLEINYTARVKDKQFCCCRDCLCLSGACFLMVLFGSDLSDFTWNSWKSIFPSPKLNMQSVCFYNSCCVCHNKRVHTDKQTELSSDRA